MSSQTVWSTEARFFKLEVADAWDEFVARSANGGLLHTRRFLDYHGDRLQDASLMFHDSATGNLIGLMPASVAKDDSTIVVSHGGSSFGGLVTYRPDPAVSGRMYHQACQIWLAAGFQTLVVLTHPTVFHRQADDTDQVFFSLTGQTTELHLWSVIQLSERILIGKSRTAAIRKARRSDLLVREGCSEADYARFHQVLSANLAERHQCKPTHSFSDVLDLRSRLGIGSRLILVTDKADELFAASWLWDYGNGVWHSQYLCSTAAGRARDAVDVLIADCTERAKKAGQRVYSIGRSTLDDGWSVNESLLRFKKRLGCGLVAQRRVEVNLSKLQCFSASFCSLTNCSSNKD